MRVALKSIDWTLSFITILLILLLFCMSVYVLWDNRQVYEDANNIFSDLQNYKPSVGDDKGGVDPFQKLHEINPDVCAWLTVDGTRIDYPILQGPDNMFYMDHDVYRNYSIAGSVFLDSRNSKDFTDTYSIVYGHHMDNHQMFGDLDYFKDRDFLNENHTATIITEHGETVYQVLSVVETFDSDQDIFDPSKWEDGDLTDYIIYITENGIIIYEPSMGIIEIDPTMYKIVILVTCASGHTGIRTVLVLFAPRDDKEDEPPVNPVPTPTPIKPPKTWDSIVHSQKLWITVFILNAIALAATIGLSKKSKNNRRGAKKCFDRYRNFFKFGVLRPLFYCDVPQSGHGISSCMPKRRRLVLWRDLMRLLLDCEKLCEKHGLRAMPYRRKLDFRQDLERLLLDCEKLCEKHGLRDMPVKRRLDFRQYESLPANKKLCAKHGLFGVPKRLGHECGVLRILIDHAGLCLRMIFLSVKFRLLE